MIARQGDCHVHSVYVGLCVFVCVRQAECLGEIG